MSESKVPVALEEGAMLAQPVAQGPQGHPLFGHAADLSRNGLPYLQRCAREYGDLVPLRFFWKPILFVNHPDYIAQVLAVQQRNLTKDIAQRADRPLVGDGLFLSEGDFWLQQRRLMQPAFHRERLAAYGEAMVAATGRMLASWRDGETRDIYRAMSELTMAIVAESLFGADLRDEAAEIAAALENALTAMGARVRSIQVLLPDTLPTPTNRRLHRARERIDRLVYRLIADRRRGGDERGDLLSLLLGARDAEGAALSDRQLRDEVMTILVGGYETAADLLSWAWHLLAQHPAAAARLHAELAAILGGRTPTVADLPRLAYAGMIVSETLRLYPPAPALGREAIAPFSIDGYPVASGTDILVSQWVMHRDPRYFADPDSFLPERWGGDFAARLPRYAYFPFGGGPRRCIGHAFATMELTLVLATIAQQFRLEAVPGFPVVPEMIPTLRPKHGLRMVIHRR